MIKFLKWIHRWWSRYCIKRPTIEKQKSFINKLPEPKDGFERSYLQYRCWSRIVGWFATFLYNVASVPIYLMYRRKYSASIDSANMKSERDNIAVFYGIGHEKKIPDELYTEFKKIILIEEVQQEYCKSDYSFLCRNMIKRYKFSIQFLLKNCIKMSIYRWMINTYQPLAIITCNEFSFTSSFLTEFCKENDIEHINIMHGEKKIDIVDSFFRFNRYYVWDEYYIKLLTELRADMHQFIVAIPSCLIYQNMKVEKQIDYTYYLQCESKCELKFIANVLLRLKRKGLKVAYRPHPRYDTIKTRSIFSDIEREDGSTIDIGNSIMRTGNVIAKYSTVLYEASLNDVNIVIDDITNPKEYKEYIELKPLIIEKKHQLLSEIMRSINYDFEEAYRCGGSERKDEMNNYINTFLLNRKICLKGIFCMENVDAISGLPLLIR